MPWTSTRAQPWAPPRRDPLWWRLGRGTLGTVRELRHGPTDAAGPGMRLVPGPDGALTLAPPAPARELASTRTARWVWRSRRTLAPLPVAAGYAILNGVPLDGPRPLVAAFIAAPLFAASMWSGILGGADRTRATLTLMAATVLALQVWWLWPDAPPGTPAAIAAAAVSVSAYRFRIRPPEDPTPDPDRPREEAMWDEHVGAPGGILPGSTARFLGYLHPDNDPARDPIGFRLDVTLVRGKHESSTLAGRLGLIAGVYDAEKTGMVLDRTGTELRCLLTLTTREAVTDVQTTTAPTLDTATGCFRLMTLADATAGLWVLWIPGQGIRHGWFVGAMGSGKSTAVDLFLMNLLSEGIAVADLVDLKGGASIPHWEYRAVRFGNTFTDGLRALLRGVLLAEYRYDVMAGMPAVRPDGSPAYIDGKRARGRTWVDPSPDWPIYCVLIEEWTQLALHPKYAAVAVARAGRVAALGRAALVMLEFVTQPANLDLAFGGNRDLRTNVQAGNVCVLWTDQTSGNLATATRTIDVSAIPQGQAGVGYLAGPAQPRDVRGRVEYLEDPWPAVEAARPATLSVLETAVLAAADAMSDGVPFPDILAAALAAAPHDPEWRDRIGRVLAPYAPAPTPGRAPDTASPAAAPAAAALTEGQAAVVAALTANRGGLSAKDLRAALGGDGPPVTDQALRRHLNPLADDGTVTRTGRGRWTLVSRETSIPPPTTQPPANPPEPTP